MTIMAWRSTERVKCLSFLLTDVMFLQFKLEEYMKRLKNGDKLNQDQLVCVLFHRRHKCFYGWCWSELVKQKASYNRSLNGLMI